MTLKCSECRDLLHQTESQLSGEAGGRLERHLTQCADCRLEARLLRELRASDIPDPGPVFWANLPAKVIMEVESAAAATPPRLWRVPGWSPAKGFAAMTLTAALLLALLWPGTLPGPGQKNLQDGYPAAIVNIDLGTETDLFYAALEDLGRVNRALDQELAFDSVSQDGSAGGALLGLDALATDRTSLHALEEVVDGMLPEIFQRG